jgi:hypothetical protein
MLVFARHAIFYIFPFIVNKMTTVRLGFPQIQDTFVAARLKYMCVLIGWVIRSFVVKNTYTKKEVF